MRYYSRADIRDKFKHFIRMKYPTQTAAAKDYGVSTQYMSDVIRGRTVPNKSMLNDLGFEGRAVFTKVKHKSCDVEE